MRIALVTDGIYPFVTGGMQRHSYLLCKYLSVNHSIDLYHFKKNEVSDTIKELFPDSHVAIREFVLPYNDAMKYPFHYLFSQKYYSNQVYSAFNSVEKPDLIICKGFTGWRFLREKKMGKLEIPVLLNFHGMEMFQKAFTIREKIVQYIFKKIVRQQLHESDYCFSYGGEITRILTDDAGVPSQKIIEFPACIESIQINHQSKSFVGKIQFCFVGRFERRKGIKELNQALLALIPGNNFVFHFIGDIPPEHQVNADFIFYHGKMNSMSQINAVLDQCDVLVCPSWSEGMPNVILEAMSRGVAVAATRVGAVETLVNASTGWIIKGNSPNHIISALSEILSASSDLILKKKQNAQRHILNNFIWENKINEMERLLSDVCLKKSITGTLIRK